MITRARSSRGAPFLLETADAGKAQTRAVLGRELLAARQVHKSTRQLADKITAEPIGKWFDTFDLRTRAVVLPAGTMSAVLQAQGVELIVAPAKKKRPRKTRRK